MKHPIDLIVFDWDGTLMDSAARIVACLQAAIAQTGLPALPARRLRGIIGLGLHEAMVELYPGEPAARLRGLADAYRQRYLTDRTLEERLFDGAERVVAGLAQSHLQLAVATGKSRPGLDRALDRTGLGRYFGATRCADEAPSKPNPHMLEDIMDFLGVEPGNTLMVGDTEFDLAMARSAGAHSVGVTYGVHPPERLRPHRPLRLIDTLEELPALMRDLTPDSAAPRGSTAGRRIDG
jgi:phosphoglycolate phosphatase